MLQAITQQDKITFFQTIEFLRDLDPSVLERIAALSTDRLWKANTTVFYEGDRGDAMFCILSGEVHVYKTTECGRNIDVVTLGPGAYFGHLALLDRQARSASIRTTQETRLLETRHLHFQQLLKTYPQTFWKILTGLSVMLQAHKAPQDRP
jgi:CRP-like cAMP-binding protein